MEERLPREVILGRLSLEYQQLMRTFGQLTPEQWLTAGAVGAWTARDVLAHLVFWNGFCVQELEAAKDGRSFPHPEGTEDAINARAVASFADQTPDAVRQAFEDSYAVLVNCIQTLPDYAFEAGGLVEQALDDTIHGALANNTYEHWPIHEAQIREWLAAQH